MTENSILLIADITGVLQAIKDKSNFLPTW